MKIGKESICSIRFPISFDGRPLLDITAPPLNADGEAIRSALKNQK